MANALFLSPRLSDAAVLTASSAVASLPASFAQNPEPTKVWRTTGVAGEYLVFDFGTPIVVNAAVASAHNLTAAATLRLRLAASVVALTSGPAVDSGAVSAWPTSGKHSDPNWPHEVSLVTVSNSTAYRYARLDLADAANPAGHLDVGRVAVGQAWQPVANIDLDPTISFVANDVQEATGYGQVFTDPRPWAQRQFDLNFSSSDEGDIYDFAMELSRLRGQAGDLFVFIDPAATTRFNRWSMQALFAGRASYKAQALWASGNKQIWAFSASLIEKL